MPKNKGKGGKSKRKGKNKNDDGDKRELVMKEQGQEYAQVSKVLGNCRIEAVCFDGHTRMCHVRGKFRKKVWINKDDIVLVGLRDYQDGKADIIHKYTAEEARNLKALGELPEKARINESADLIEEENDGLVDFASAANGSTADKANANNAKSVAPASASESEDDEDESEESEEEDESEEEEQQQQQQQQQRGKGKQVQIQMPKPQPKQRGKMDDENESGESEDDDEEEDDGTPVKQFTNDRGKGGKLLSEREAPPMGPPPRESAGRGKNTAELIKHKEFVKGKQAGRRQGQDRKQRLQPSGL